MIRMILVLAAVMAATIAVAQSGAVPVASFDLERDARRATVQRVDVGDGVVCYVLDSRRSAAISCVRE